jgi:hypothetical protein
MLGKVIVSGLNEVNIIFGLVNGGKVTFGMVSVGTVNDVNDVNDANEMLGVVIVGTVTDANRKVLDGAE